MDVVHRRGRATVAEIQAEMPKGVSYSAIRSALRLLREKNVLRHEHDGKRYVYLPVISPEQARESALRHVIRTFFEGSRTRTVGAILEMSDTDLTGADLERLSRLIADAQKSQNGKRR